MSQNPISRRNFMSSVAGTGLVLGMQEAIPAPLARLLADPEPLAPPGKIKMVCTHNFSPAEINQVRAAAGKNVEWVMATDKKDLARHLADAEVVLGSLDAAEVKAARKLKWVQTFAAGVEKLPKELMEHPSQLTNMQRVFAPVIAETAIALLLSLTRGLAQVSVPAFEQRKWQQPPPGFVLEDLYGKTIGIVGMGGIGSETARRLHYGFSMRVLATDPKPMPKPEFVAELHDPGWFMEMVPQVDVLMSAAPLTKVTAGMFNEAVFSKMKPSAYFINVSRGGLVDQEALVKALKAKRIRGAGLDVATPEPLPPESSLWDCDNLVITPHNSGSAAIRQVRLVALVSENVRRYSEGLPLMNVVDKAKGY